MHLQIKPKKHLLWGFLLFLIFTNCSSSSKLQEVKIDNGYLDLTKFDFEQTPKVTLRGEWKFKWCEDHPDYIDPSFDDSQWDTCTVPIQWKEKTGTNEGYAWYRLKIKLNLSQNLSIYTPGVNSSYCLFVNGKELVRNGSPGPSKATTISNRYPIVEKLPEADEYIFAWKVANFHHGFGGIWVAPVIGNYDFLKKEQWLRDLYHTIIMGICLIMGLYYITMWFFLNQETSALFLGTFCLIMFIRILSTEYFFVRIMLPYSLTEMKFKLEALSVCLGAATVGRFIYHLFPEYSIKQLRIILEIFCIFFIVLILFSESSVYTALLIPKNIYLILYCFWSIHCIGNATVHRKNEAFIILGGILFLSITIFHDIFIEMQFITTKIFLAHFGLVILIIAQSLVLSMRFSRAFHTARHLSINLQQEVEVKTKKITQQNLNLAKLHKEKNTFFINLAHETKTPLTLLSNYLESYLKKHRLTDELIIMKQSVDKLCRDMVNFLDSEKLEKGAFEFNNNKTIDLSCFIEQKIPLFNAIALKKKQKIIDEVQPGILIKADPLAIDRIVNNLIENAIKYTDEYGEIEVSLSAVEDDIIFKVKDNGIGITLEHQKNIFSPYYQISWEKQNRQGMGIGLYIVSEIIKSLKGTIEVNSEPQLGSEFTVKLKPGQIDKNETINLNITGSKPQEGFYISSVNDGEYMKERHNILFVEDNLELLNYLKTELEGDYNVFCAENGRKALEKLVWIEKPDIVVSDIMMDEMDGLSMLDEFYKDEKLMGIPFIFLTAKTSFQDKLQGLDEGAVDFISKPFEMEELRKKIKSLINLKDNQKEHNMHEMKSKLINFLQEPTKTLSLDEIILNNKMKFNYTDREHEIIKLLIRGQGNKEICSELGMALSTVKNYISAIYKKCNAQNRVEFVNIMKG